MRQRRGTWRPLAWPYLSIALCLSTLPARLGTQGVTSAAIQGRLIRTDGRPIPGAALIVTNAANGHHWQVVASSAGTFALENVDVGGPYIVEARAVGYRPIRSSIGTLALGRRYVADFVLQPAAVVLEAVAVATTADRLTEAGRSGPVELISDSLLARLPNLSRDLASLALLSPWVSPRPFGGISIGAQNPAFNRFQIDGGENGDTYLGREPGGAGAGAIVPQVLPRAVSLESVRELQVLVAPFDVRQGSFAGGVVNVVTRAGSNSAHGSAFSFFQNQTLAAGPTARATSEDFAIWQLGGSSGGPIRRDRVHYFVSGDFQRRVVPDPGPLIVDTAGGAELTRIGISHASAVRFDSILRHTYAIDPGRIGASEGRVPALDLFAKITAQSSRHGTIELSHHYASGRRYGFVRREYRVYRLTSNAEEDVSIERATRLRWSSLFRGRHANELLVSYLGLHDYCRPEGHLPSIQVDADNGRLVAGPNQVCPTTSVAQEELEVTDNLSVGVGAHTITVGTHDELLHFRDPLLLTSAGIWMFASLDALAAGQARRYEIGLPGPARRPVDFHVWQVGVYAQDRWTTSTRLAVTAGLRLDTPLVPDAAVTNPAARASLGIDTGRLPSRGALWSPRLSVTYDLRGEGATVLRGGIGVFSGHPPYRWIGNAYRDDGTQELQLTCVGANVPPFDPHGQPTSCRTGGPVPRTSFFGPHLRFPQSVRLSLGVDRRLPWGWIATVELLRTRGLHEWYWTDVNLGPPSASAPGEGGRLLYGTIDAAGIARPLRRDTTFGSVVRVVNRSGDRSESLSLGLRRSFARGTAFSAAYAYARAEDRMSPVGVNAVANLAGTPLDGTLDARRLGRSFFEVPHRVSLSGTVTLPHEVAWSLVYAGGSGTPFTFVINGDANADGLGVSPFTNDIVYVPRDRADISIDGNGAAAGAGTAAQQDSAYDLLASYIARERCLRDQRGRILARNSCRNPWLGMLNSRLATTLSMPAGRRLEISADVFDVPNLLNSRWGRYRATTDGTSVTGAGIILLQLAGHDAANRRGVYRVALPARRQVVDAASRWRVQLGARYGF